MLFHCLTLMFLLVVSASPALAGDLRVMTQNLYVGGDLLPAIQASTLGEFVTAAQTILAEIAANNFPVRADALATEIAERRPDLVGLQEVEDFTLNGTHGAPPFRDYLDDLLTALAARGANYYVAATVRNLDVTVAVSPGTVIGIVDRDVILARADVPTSVVPLGCFDAGHVSVDGCNFAVAASFPSPVFGPISIERGYVAVVALVDGQLFVVVDTHLEPRLPSYPLLALVQSYQALELLNVSLALQQNPFGIPVIVVGDMNSSPDDDAVAVDGVAAVPPYAMFVAAGLTDTWLLRPGRSVGNTCCELPDLSNPTPVLTERVDLILSTERPVEVRANVLGNEPPAKTGFSGLWPSDHAGVVATLSLLP